MKQEQLLKRVIHLVDTRRQLVIPIVSLFLTAGMELIWFLYPFYLSFSRIDNRFPRKMYVFLFHSAPPFVW